MGERTVESLAAQVVFTAPELSDPVVAEAVAAYGEFIRNFVIAQGLPDRNYPPLLAGLDPAFVDSALSGTRENIDAGFLTLGPFTEKVQEADGDLGSVFILSCRDYRERTFYLAADGSEVSDQEVGLVPVLVTMTKTPDRWIILDSNRSERTCP